MYALTVPAHPQSIGVISAFVWAIASDLNLSRSRAYRLRLAVDEIVTNIIQHGYAPCQSYNECHHPISLWVEVEIETVSITIEDLGMPYDITQADAPTDLHAPLHEREIGGLGVYLITQYVDDILYERVGGRNINRLTINRF